MTLFDRIAWRDPVTGRRLEPRVTARTPAGGPICGARVVSGTSVGFPIVDGVARLTPELVPGLNAVRREAGVVVARKLAAAR
jgi:hypothetical protein